MKWVLLNIGLLILFYLTGDAAGEARLLSAMRRGVRRAGRHWLSYH